MAAASLPIVEFAAPCPHRSDERAAEPFHAAICGRAAELPEVGRPVAVNAAACAVCQGGGWSRVAKSFAVSVRRRGHVAGEEAGSLLDLFPPPGSRVLTPGADKATRWAVGVMVAKRANGEDYLPGTLRAIQAAGWPDPWVFAERDAAVPDGFGVTRWPGREPMGCHGAHRNAIGGFVENRAYRKADAILLFEDDVWPAPGLREYLEENVLWPDWNIAGLNLFLSSAHAEGPAGWHPHAGWGGQALLFHRAAAEQYLADLRSVHQDYHDDAERDRNGDATAQNWAFRAKRPWWVARGRSGASLVSHRGEGSSIWKHATLAGDRRERVWAGDLLAKRPTTPVPAKGLAEARMEVCSTCPMWRHMACRCPRQQDRVDHATAHVVDLACPLGKWPAVAP